MLMLIKQEYIKKIKTKTSKIGHVHRNWYKTVKLSRSYAGTEVRHLAYTVSKKRGETR